MKKFFAILCATLIMGLTACSHVHCQETSQKPVKVVASTFPVWLFTANIIADTSGIDLELLIPAAAGCPHDFALKPADLQKLAQAKALIINGAGLEEFLAKPLANMENKPDIIDASVNIPLLDNQSDAHDHINPHVFAAPGEAFLMVRNIAAGLAALDEANAEKYAANAAAYMEKLNALSKKLEHLGQAAKNRGIVLEHDGLAYLAANAALIVVATIETPASPAQLATLQKLIEESKPALIAGEEQFPDRIIKTLSAETGVPYCQLNSCASGPADAPLDYYETAMTKNIEILEKYFAKPGM